MFLASQSTREYRSRNDPPLYVLPECIHFLVTYLLEYSDFGTTLSILYTSDLPILPRFTFLFCIYFSPYMLLPNVATFSVTSVFFTHKLLSVFLCSLYSSLQVFESILSPSQSMANIYYASLDRIQVCHTCSFGNHHV